MDALALGICQDIPTAAMPGSEIELPDEEVLKKVSTRTGVLPARVNQLLGRTVMGCWTYLCSRVLLQPFANGCCTRPSHAKPQKAPSSSFVSFAICICECVHAIGRKGKGKQEVKTRKRTQKNKPKALELPTPACPRTSGVLFLHNIIWYMHTLIISYTYHFTILWGSALCAFFSLQCASKGIS